MAHIIARYAAKERCIVIISGPSGVGKSTLGRILAEALRTPDCDPLLWPDMTFDVVIRNSPQNYTVEEPLVMVCNEFDEILGEEDEDGRTLSKSEVCNAMDMIADLEHVLLVITTNREITDIPFVFRRGGRVSLYARVQQSDTGDVSVAITIPPPTERDEKKEMEIQAKA